MQLLLFLAFSSLLGVYAKTLLEIADAPWAVSFVGREYANGQTTFKYSANVNSLGQRDLISWMLAIPQCEEITGIQTIPDIGSAEITVDPLSGVNGLEWATHVAAGQQSFFRVTVNGHVSSEDLQYVVKGAGGAEAEYAVGSVEGPACSTIPDAECNAGGPYYAQCVHHTVLVSLTSTSKQVHSQEWSVTDAALSLDTPTAINPLLTINPTSLSWNSVDCSVDHQVALLVYGEDGQSSCVAHITLNDTVAPSFLGLDAPDIVVESDDIPATPEVRASDSCDGGVTVTTKEVSLGSDPGMYKLVRTWTATDFCHNKAEHVQTITVQDTTPPVLVGVEESITAECDAVPPPCEVEAIDYNEVSVSFTEARYNVPGKNCDNYYKLVRTWTAADSAGNKNSASQTILVQDTAAPVISGAPDDEVVECDEVPAAPSLIALDACGSNTLTFNEEKVGHDDSDPNNYNIVRTWTAFDACGNVATHNQYITVKDATDPLLSGVDADANIFCYEVPPPCVVTVVDNCDAELEVVYAQETVHHTCTDHYDLSRTWVAVDSSGNEASETQILRIHDLIPPKFTGLPPASLTVQCSDIPNFVVDAEDKCDPNIVVDLTETKSVNAISENEYNLYRYWVAVDRCGNQAKHTQYISVVDDVPPTLEGVPHDIQVSCNSVPDLQNSFVTVSDRCSCSVDLVVESSEHRLNGACTDAYTLVRTWVSHDCKGNPVEQVQTITVVDHEDPIMTGLPGDQQVQCSSIPEVAVVGVSDNCDTGVTVVDTEDRVGGGCVDEFTLVRTWTAADACGNDVVHHQNIVVKDTISPYFDNPNPGHNHQVECDGDAYASLGLSSPTFDYPTATDSCDSNVDVTHVDDQSEGDCPNAITVVRVYTATDDCGNYASEVQTFQVVDSTPPSLQSDFAAEVEVQFPAGADVPAPEVTPVDACNGVVDVATEEITTEWPPCPGRSMKISRTWKATDICGNVSPLLTQVITVVDTVPPIITTEPTDTVATCDNIPVAEVVTSIDTDGTPATVVMTEVISEISCLHTYVITRRWVATDECGNDASVEQVISVEDNVAPVLFGVPDDETTECEFPVDPTVTVNDACDLNVTVGSPTVVQDESLVDEIKFVVTKTWDVSDTCGNSFQKSQVITIKDTTDPIFLEVPDAITLQCYDEFGEIPDLTGLDYCDVDATVTSSVVEYPTTVCADYVIYHRKWVAEDQSGHSVEVEQIVHVIDSEGPVFVNPPADFTAECSEVLVEPPVVVTDLCDPDVEEPVVEVSEEHIENSPQHEYVVIYEYSVDDRCGNTNTHQIRVVISDITDPVFLPFDSVVELTCKDPISEQELLGASDDCYNVEPTFEDNEVSRTCPHTYTVERTWTVTDGSGNSISTVQTFIITDNVSPVLESFPHTLEVSHTDVPPHPTITATDNCADVVPTWTDETDNVNCDNSYRITYTATVEDDCGHSASAVQYVNVVDLIPPTITPQYDDITIECDDLDSLENALTVVADEGATILSTNTVTENYDCTDSYTIRRIWVAVDDCGNKATYTQTVGVFDTTAPVMDPAPADENYECTYPGTFVLLTVRDNCGDDHVISPVLERVDEENPTNYKLVATWSYSDPCSNSVSEVQTITVTDTTPPTVINVPATTNVDYTQIPIANADTVACEDNCAHSVASYSTDLVEGSCVNNYDLVRTWTCTDQAGQTDTVVITVTVEDVGNLAFTNYPADQTMEWITGLGGSLPVAVVGTNKPGVIPVYSSSNDALDGDMESDLEFTITRTWTAEDECENIVTQSQIITIVQPVPPVLPELPPNVYVECSDVEDYITGSFLEAATESITINVPVDNELTSSVTSERGSCDNEFNVIVTWTATDEAGQTISDDMTIFVTDSVPPTWVTPPASFTSAECVEPPVELYDAWDNCAQDLMPDTTDGFGDSGGQITPTITSVAATLELDGFNGFIRTYTAMDACGNVITATQDVQIVDTQKPVFDDPIPADVTISCSDTHTPVTLTATDNCDSVTVVPSCSGDTNPCNYDQTCTWYAIDESGNEVLGTQIITIEDSDAPTFTNDPFPDTDLVVECTDIPVKVELIASDNCGTAHLNFDETTGPTDCTPYTITRTYVATDDCGLSSTFIQNLVVQDTNPPTLVGVLGDATQECGTVAPVSFVTVFDDCDVNPPFYTPELETEIGTCSEEVIHHKTWVVTDCTGETLPSLTETRDITYSDTTPPTISGISAENKEITVVCPNVVAPDPSLTVDDNCDAEVELELSLETLSQTDAFNYIVLRTWIASDSCGNTVSDEQTVIFEDVTPPTIACVPVPTIVACNDVSAANPAENFVVPPIVADSCSSATLTGPFLLETDTTCTGTYDLTYKWIATDGSGLQSTCTQAVNVVDDSPPYFEINPDDLTIECGESIPNVESVPIVDSCSVEVTNTPSEVTSPGDCNGEYTMVRKWDAHDDCGHHRVHFQNIEIKDNQSPVLSGVPDDETYSCEDVPTPTDHGVTATDICQPDVDVLFEYEVTSTECEDSSGTYDWTLVWSAQDVCGNLVEESVEVSVYDIVDPIINGVPEDITVDCADIPDIPTLTVTDNCHDTTIAGFKQETFDGASPFQKELINTWSGSDPCGNSVSASQKIWVTDDIPPVFNYIPVDAVYDCDHQWVVGGLNAEDNCAPGTASVTQDGPKKTHGTCDDAWELVTVWVAVDEAGNEATVSQTIGFVDNSPPHLINGPGNEAVECDSIPPSNPLHAEDTCTEDLVPVVATEEMVDQMTATDFKLIRTWTVSDDCGNTDTHIQTIYVSDSLDPVFNMASPENLEVSCSSIPDPEVITGTDNCIETITVLYTEQTQPGDCTHDYILTRNWVAEDASGNSIEVSQVITVSDGSPPSLYPIPADETVSCEVPHPVPNVDGSDDCSGGVDVALDQVTAPGLTPNDYLIIRTWTAVDDCSLSVVVVQTVSVTDNISPVILGSPSSEVEVGSVPVPGTGQVTDNCDTTVPPEVPCEESREDSGACDSNYTLTYTCHVTDASGNYAEHIYQVVVRDTTPPVFYFDGYNAGVAPPTVTYEYGEEPSVEDALMGVVAVDNSENEITLSPPVVNVLPGANDHEFTITWTYSACDDCGNCAEIDRTIVVEDTTPPCLSEEPPSEDVECDNIPPPCEVTTVDEDLTVVTDHSSLFLVGDEKYITRTWSATDDSGNSVTHIQTLRVVDLSPPVFSRYPQAEITVSCSCDSFPLAPTVNAIDNCDMIIDVVYIEDKLPTLSPDSYVLERLWTAVDDSGNQARHRQVITVEDKESPVLSKEPADKFVECDNVPDADDIYMQDNCDPDVVVNYDKSTVSGGCAHAYQITNRWTASDRTGNPQNHVQVVTVQDSQAPTFESVESHCILPNGQYKEFSTTGMFEVADNCDVNVGFTIYSCNSTDTSAEDTAFFDVNCHFDNERSILSVKADAGASAEGRTYEVYAAATDDCGNHAYYARQFWIPATEEDAAMEGLICDVADVDSLVDTN